MSDKTAHDQIPVVEETVAIDKREKVTGVVRATTKTHADEVVVDEPMLSEQVEIERVPMDRFIVRNRCGRRAPPPSFRS